MMFGNSSQNNLVIARRKERSAILFTLLMLLTSYSAIEFATWEAMGSTDADGDGLPYGLEYYINTQPQDWDSDGDGLPDGWEWQYGLDPLSASGINGSTGDPDGDSLTNLNEYQYGIPSNWDSATTPNKLDNGVWWNGTVPVSNWDEESAMQLIQGLNSDGADEDPMGNICFNTFDDDHDGMVDSWDGDNDGDADCSSNDDDGDNLTDEDPDGWDTDGDGMPDGWEVANNLDPTSNSGDDGTYGDPDGDGLINLYEYVNPAWDTRNGTTNPPTQYWKPGPDNRTNTESPCNPVLGLGPGSPPCSLFTAEVDGITYTDPNNNDTDGDGLNDSYEALVLLTDPTAVDTDGDGISDGVEVNGSYGNPPQASDPRNNNTDGDQFDDGEEDTNFNGVVDANETDPTRIEDSGDFDGDGIQNWEENATCTLWDVADTDGGGIDDGTELSPAHGTNPCTSTYEIYLDVIAWLPVGSSVTVNNTSKLDPTPIDWRQDGAPMAYFESAIGNRTPFQYSSIDGNILRSVSITMPSDAQYVVVLNGSWCWDASLGSANEQHCDDDYLDTDGDGLADWEESLGSWGFESIPTLTDSDGDGVNDFDEIINATDPLEPCDNLNDFDGDGLNNYFENTTGCPLIFGIENGNMSLDNYTTLWNNSDTDNGGVIDYQEYLDGTNPQNNPDDDLNPQDTDGDGIPDTIEREMGTDWLDPDTDGGGIPDGDECPPEYWENGCLDSPFNPWDPTDDVSTNMLYFFAENTTIGVDFNQTHYWRWHTYDYYTGVSWGVNKTLVGYTQMFPTWSTTQGVAHPDFWDNSALHSWQISFRNNGILSPGEELIAPYNAVNYTSWSDTSSGLNFSNYTRDVLIDSSTIDELFVTTPQVIFTDAIRDNTTAFQNSTYATEYDGFDNVSIITQQVLNESGWVSAWDQIEAIQQFLINGNNTTVFLRNHAGSNLNRTLTSGVSEASDDIAVWILEEAQEGDCDEFATVFAAMLRSIGLPTRKVTGFSGGTWVDNGFEVYGNDFSWWVEVHLQTNANQGELDLGWIPFEACPDASVVEVVDETYSPDTLERDYSSGNITLNGTLQFVSNSSSVEGITLELYLTPDNETANVPGSAALATRLIGTAVTDSEGFFSFNGSPSEMIIPGYGSLVVLTQTKGYVGVQAVTFPWVINITDDVNLEITNPIPIDQPMLGVGVNTSVTGYMALANLPQTDPALLDSLQVLLNFTTIEDGEVNLISDLGAGGYFEFRVPISENEPLGLINASLAFLGWHQSDLNNASIPEYHLRPKTLDFNFNITPSPDLSISLEGSDSNSSILDINELIFINGTAVSRGPSPDPLNGTLIFQMRRAGTNGPYTDLATWSLNSSNWTTSPGQFAIQWDFNESSVPIPAGLVDVKFIYTADDLFASDEESFVSSFGIRSYVEFEYTLNPTERGLEASVAVQLSDHTGTSVADFAGTYAVDFNGTEVFNITDPDSGNFNVVWIPNADMFAGDYEWRLNYTGSTWLRSTSVSDTIRIQGRANVTVTLGSEWTDGGTVTWVSGFAQDTFHLTPITGNNSSIVVQMEVPSELPPGPDGSPAPPIIVPLTNNGWINETTGFYNYSFTMPGDVRSGAYFLRFVLDFSTTAEVQGPFYTAITQTRVLAGLQSEFVVDAEPQSIIVIAGTTLLLNATITDIADETVLSDVDVDLYFDWGGPNQVIIDSATTDVDGVARFNPTILEDTTPGFYDLRVHAADDLTDNLTDANPGRWIGNDTFANLTVQVDSQVEITSIPLEVTAGQSFTLSGRVLDGFDGNRSVSGPMAVEVFFLNDSSETLVSSHTTTNNGSFSVSVPTDPFGDGVSSGTKTVVVSVIEGSTPFYLTGTGNASILVKGVTRFTDRTPIIQTVVDRGTSITFGARLTEFSDNDLPVGDTQVAAKFHDTWLTEGVTNGQGLVNFTFDVPHSHPLGLIGVTLYFNGSSTLHSTITVMNQIFVRSPTNLTISSVTDNPVAGESFNVSGTLLSSNGTGIMDRTGAALPSSLTFSIDGTDSGFQVTGGVVNPNGTWSAVITLGLSFPRGTHNITASYTPTVNYYGSSSDTGTFDSRGYSLISILDPADLDPDRRVVRGDDVSVNLSIIDNAGQLVENAEIDILVDGSFIQSVTTDSTGRATLVIPVDSQRIQGSMLISAEFPGINGTTGLIGDSTWSRVIVLAPTVIEFIELTGSMVAGENITFTGTLLDEHGQLLTDNGLISGGVIHIWIDGIDVGSAYTTVSNASTGQWRVTYDLPLDMDYGAHTVTAKFLGGFTWVDPMGQGDSLNPEYYLPSATTIGFNVTQTSQVVLTTPPGEVDRNELLLIEGMLTDGAGRTLGDRYLEVTMNGQFLTGLQVENNGTFSVYLPIPPDMPLGPRLVKIIFQGEEFILPSNSTTVFTVYAPTIISIDPPSAYAVGDEMRLTGTVRDNLPDGGLANHSLEIFIDGTLVGITTSREDGDWSFNWVVSDFLDIGFHTITVTAPAQGYYRPGSIDANLTIAYHTAINLQVDDVSVTRGEQWNFTGRLFDSDTAGAPGLSGREIIISLDGAEIDRITTGNDGVFEFDYSIGYLIARGGHDVRFTFEGQTFYLPVEYNMTVYAKADIQIEVLWETDLIIRSDESKEIKLVGRIVEVGGESNVIEGMEVVLLWDGLAEPSTLVWDESTGHFELISPARSTMPPGELSLTISALTDADRFLNGVDIEHIVNIRVPVTFTFTPDSHHIKENQRRINGTVTVTANDTGLPVEGISIVARLVNQSVIHFQNVKLTDSNGIMDYDFTIQNQPAFYDKNKWGELFLQFQTDSQLINPSDRLWLNNDYSGIEMTYEDPAPLFTFWQILALIGIILILGTLVGLGLSLRRRRLATLDEMAGIFSYTAELLAAGDEIREAIFTCYESLCNILMRNGFLRRDFETVREFEMAIRKALPISEEALVALDRIFEEARYSSHKLGDGHRQNAQHALSMVLQEIDGLQDVPERDSFDLSEAVA